MIEKPASKIETLRPVEVLDNGNKKKGYFHRFVYSNFGYYSETRVLVELADGRLRFFDPYFVQFTDRNKIELKKDENSNDSSGDFH